MMRFVTVIGSGTSLEGDRWVLGRDSHDGGSVTYLEVETLNGHHSKGAYGSPPLPPGWRLATYTRHDDVSPDQIILRVAGDVAGVTVTLSDGLRDRLRLYSDPTHTGVGLAALVYPRDLDIHRIDLLGIGRFGRAAARSPVARPIRDSHSHGSRQKRTFAVWVKLFCTGWLGLTRVADQARAPSGLPKVGQDR
jgi:hypothetical protein